MILIDQIPANAPNIKRKIPITHPERQSTYGSERTPPPTAADTRDIILPRTLPLFIFPKVLSMNLFLYIAPGE
jgi:hypothetical protein